MKQCFIFLFLVIVPTITFAQNDSLPKLIKGVHMNYTTVYGNFDNLSEKLENHGYNRLENEQNWLFYGYSDRHLNKKSYTTLQLGFLWNSYSNYNTELNQANLMLLSLVFDFHFIFYKSEKWFFHPYVSGGLIHGYLELKDHTPISDFEEVITSSYKRISLVYPTSFYSIGIELDRKLKIRGEDFYFGLAIGYRFSIQNYLSTVASETINFSGFEAKINYRFEFNNHHNIKHK